MNLIAHFNPDVTKLFAALVLGGIIGLEREFSNKVAGLRTNILICVSATMFTIISVKFFDVRDAHIPAQIITGIGFLGAGAIMRDGEHVIGLTTAATIWVVAAVGIGLGFGYYFLSSIVTIMILFVQLAFTPLDTLIDQWQERHHFRIISKQEDRCIDEINKIFRDSKVFVIRRKLMKRNQIFYSEWFTAGSRKQQEQVMKKLLASEDVLEVSY